MTTSKASDKDKETMYSEDNMELVNATPKHSITIIPASDEISIEEFQQQIDRLNELMEKYEALYIHDAMLSRIQRRGLKEILRARIIQILSKIGKYNGSQMSKDAMGD